MVRVSTGSRNFPLSAEQEAEKKAVQEKEETVINMLKNQISVDLIGKIMNMSAESVRNVAAAYGIAIEEPVTMVN